MDLNVNPEKVERSGGKVRTSEIRNLNSFHKFPVFRLNSRKIFKNKEVDMSWKRESGRKFVDPEDSRLEQHVASLFLGT